MTRERCPETPRAPTALPGTLGFPPPTHTPAPHLSPPRGRQPLLQQPHRRAGLRLPTALLGAQPSLRPTTQPSLSPSIPMPRAGATPVPAMVALLLAARPWPDGLQGAPIAPSARAPGTPQPGLRPDQCRARSFLGGGNGYGRDARARPQRRDLGTCPRQDRGRLRGGHEARQPSAFTVRHGLFLQK